MESQEGERGSFLAREISRRRLAMAAGVLAAVGVAPWAALAAQTPTAEPVDPDVAKMMSLSRELCGGGTFDQAGAEQLLRLITDDANLAPGLTELFELPEGELPPSMLASVSANADATTKAILYYWYTGTFNGAPIPNRADRYTNLLAWQALYTPAWTVCKVYGEWANPPSNAPQVAAIEPLAIATPLPPS